MVQFPRDRARKRHISALLQRSAPFSGSDISPPCPKSRLSVLGAQLSHHFIAHSRARSFLDAFGEKKSGAARFVAPAPLQATRNGDLGALPPSIARTYSAACIMLLRVNNIFNDLRRRLLPLPPLPPIRPSVSPLSSATQPHWVIRSMQDQWN